MKKAVLVFLVLLVLSGCAGGIFSVQDKGGPPPWAPAHGARAKHQYRFYPAAGVYFDIGRNLYFYLKGGQWVMVPRLPMDISINLSDFVVLDMDTDKPFLYYSEHLKKYPPGQAKKSAPAVKKVKTKK